MDSWKYMVEGRGVCLPEELDYTVDDHHGCSKNKVMLNVDSHPFVSNTQALEGLDFIDMGFSDEIRRSYSILSDKIVTDFKNVSTSFGEDKVCGEVMHDSENRGCSIVDLKLGWLADVGGVKNSAHEVSNSECSPEKRARSANLYMQSPRCLVLGCNKDLSSFKGYYKRHKVCDEHTRTARVIVHGIEQRFCQQCSRFHQLNEFDEGKRSCRRRLAAHNKRRRKPQLASNSGSGIIEFSASCASSEVLPGDDPSRYEEFQWVEHVKVEDPMKNSDVLLHISVGETEKNFTTGVESNVVGMTTPTAAILNSSNVLQASRALSLLSAESHYMSGQMLETAMTTPLFNKNGHAESSVAHSINNSAGIFKDVGQSGLHAPGMYMEVDDMESTRVMHSDNDNADDLHLPRVGISSKSNTRNPPLGRGIILDLLELSLHLQRVEQQRHLTESEAG